MQVLESLDVDPEVAWLGSFVAGVLAIAAAALAFPRTVYDRFLWRYFWGPVRADAEAANCAVRSADGTTRVFDAAAQCDPAQYPDAVLATPGYTTVSTIGYMVILVYMLVGVYFLLQRVDLRPYSEFLLALVPFMLFGGAFRVVEDATDAAATAGVDPAIGYPLNTLLISPVIYGTVFVLSLGALLLAKWIQGQGLADTFYYPLAGIGLTILLGTLSYLIVLAFTRDYVHFYPLIVLTVVGLATLIAVAVYLGFERYAPEVNAGTGILGLVVLWGHAVDGVANVAATDWVHRFYDLGPYGSKHVFNQFVIDVTSAVQPEWLNAAIGTAWPFLVVKVAVAAAIVYLFDETFMEENPRYSIMLLGAVVAVGLGPGTRDVLRVTFGI